MDLKEESILGQDITTHWYYVSKGHALCRLISDLRVDGVLDVGAGSGVFSRQLLDAGICQRAVCVDTGYTEERSEAHNGKAILFTRSINSVSEKLILMMDVLEHVDDDVGLLRKYTDRMPPGGLVLITVPAFQFLWSGHDVFLEHRRRYTLKGIESVVKAADLTIVRSRYFFGILFPFVSATRLHDRLLSPSGQIEPKSFLKKYPKFINTSLTLIHDIERTILFPLNIFAGLTVFCLARRK